MVLLPILLLLLLLLWQWLLLLPLIFLPRFSPYHFPPPPPPPFSTSSSSPFPSPLFSHPLWTLPGLLFSLSCLCTSKKVPRCDFLGCHHHYCPCHYFLQINYSCQMHSLLLPNSRPQPSFPFHTLFTLLQSLPRVPTPTSSICPSLPSVT